MFPYVFLIVVLVVALGSMGWMTAASGKSHKATMSEVKPATQELVAKAKTTRRVAQAQLEQLQKACKELVHQPEA